MTAADLLSSPAPAGEFVPPAPALSLEVAPGGESAPAARAGFGALLDEALEPSVDADSGIVAGSKGLTAAPEEPPVGGLPAPAPPAHANSEKPVLELTDGRRRPTSCPPMAAEPRTPAAPAIDIRTPRTPMSRKPVTSQQATTAADGETEAPKGTAVPTETPAETKPDTTAAEGQVLAMFLNGTRPPEPLPKPELVPVTGTGDSIDLDLAVEIAPRAAIAAGGEQIMGDSKRAAESRPQPVRDSGESEVRDSHLWPSSPRFRGGADGSSRSPSSGQPSPSPSPSLAGPPGQSSQNAPLTATPRERALGLAPRIGANSSAVPSFVPQVSAPISLDAS